MPELVLYHKITCPYCYKVKRYIQENDIDVTIKNVTDSKEIYQELLTIGGKMQVPCLFIDGKPLYESDDIITWLKDNVVDA